MLTEERKGQIALLYVKEMKRKNGIDLKPNMRREIANMAKEIGVPVEEAMEFMEEIAREIFDEAFRKEFSTGKHQFIDSKETKG